MDRDRELCTKAGPGCSGLTGIGEPDIEVAPHWIDAAMVGLEFDGNAGMGRVVSKNTNELKTGGASGITSICRRVPYGTCLAASG